MDRIDTSLKFKDNPRVITEHEFYLLKEHLEQLGDLSGVVYCRNNQAYVGGNQRSEVFNGSKIEIVEMFIPATDTKTVALGFIHYRGEKYAYREVEFDKSEFNQACIVANSAGGKWDWDRLANEWDAEILNEWGLETPDWEVPKQDVHEDDYEPPDFVETNIQVGDLIEFECEDGRVHRLLCGDSTIKADVDKLLEGEKPGIMVTDPPYGVEYDANWRNDALRADGSPIGGRAIGKVENDNEFSWLETWRLSPCDVAYIWCASWYVPEIMADAKLSGFDRRSLIIWAKNQFAISRGHYHWQHEPCLYAVRKGKSAKWIGGRSQTTVWEINKPSKSETGHSTQKPIECMARPIRNHDFESVYDPFIGSGTSMVAAHKLEKTCYAMEVNPVYCQITLDRMLTLDSEIKVKINGIAYEPKESAAF